MDNKPNCYKCKWQRDLAGSAHSKCVHPKNNVSLENPLLEVLSIFGSVGRVPNLVSGGLKVKGSEHGIKNGWFNYPFNFDPVWLLECDGYEEKGKEDE